MSSARLGCPMPIKNWRREYNTIRPHSSLGYWPPAPEALVAVGGGVLD